MKTFCWCFIGAGNLARNVAEEILTSGRHRLVSVFTRDWDKCQRFAQTYQAKPYLTAEEAINDPEVDGVYVVTPHTSHYQYARMALEAGKPVLVEKPFTVEADKTRELIHLAQEKECYLAEAMWTWFAPAAHQVKRWLDDGKLGKITRAEMSFCMQKGHYAPRLTDPKLAGGALLDVGIYPITYAYRLFGKPVKIECTGRVEGGIDLCEEVWMEFENGVRVRCISSMINEEAQEALLLDGEKGEIHCPYFHMTNEIELVGKSGERELCQGYGGYLNEFDLTAAEIRAGKKESCYVPLSATLDVMEILDECRRQIGLSCQDF